MSMNLTITATRDVTLILPDGSSESMRQEEVYQGPYSYLGTNDTYAVMDHPQGPHYGFLAYLTHTAQEDWYEEHEAEYAEYDIEDLEQFFVERDFTYKGNGVWHKLDMSPEIAVKAYLDWYKDKAERQFTVEFSVC
jgi:hypothetical protein